MMAVATIQKALGKVPWRKLLPYIGAALALLAAYHWAYGRGEAAARRALQPKLDAALASVAALKKGVAQQNAGIAAQAAAGKQVAKASEKAVRSGAERRVALEAAAARVGAVQPGKPACAPVPGDVRALWEEM
jgi:L-asparagine transporter-like permease